MSLRSVNSLSRPVLPDANLFDEQVHIEVKAKSVILRIIWHNFLTSTETLSAAIQARFRTPTANRIIIKSEQQPRQ